MSTINDYKKNLKYFDDLKKKFNDSDDISLRPKNILKSIKNESELISKCKDEHVFFGVLICFKYFKPLIKKFLQKETKKKLNKKKEPNAEASKKLQKKLYLLTQRIKKLEQKINTDNELI